MAPVTEIVEETTTVTVIPDPIKPNLPLWLTGHQCPRIEYNPTSEYKLKKGDNTGWGVVCQFVTRAQRDMNAIYVGGLESRRAEGYGEWHSEEERISYHGGFKDSVANGYGKYCDGWTVDWPDSWVKFLPGDAESEARFTYEGGFKDGLFHGYGELSFRDKSKYEGTWKEGRRWGHGKYIKDNGTVIEFYPDGFNPKKKEEPKKEPPKKQEPKKEEPKKEQPQIIYVPAATAPQVLPPYVLQPQSQHTANAGVQLSWGHSHGGSPPQTAAVPQPTVYYQPAEVSVTSQPQPVQAQSQIYYTPIEIPARPVTPTPIPVQFTYGSPPRPVTPVAPAQPVATPQPHPGFVWNVPSTTSGPGQPQAQSPAPLPYPDDPPNISGGTQKLSGSPTTTGYLAHM